MIEIFIPIFTVNCVTQIFIRWEFYATGGSVEGYFMHLMFHPAGGVAEPLSL